MTSTVPVPAGEVAVIWFGLLTVKELAGVPPKVTPVAPVKFVPLMVTLVPPTDRPVFGLTLVTVGGGKRSCACALPEKLNVNKSATEMAPGKNSQATCRIRDFRSAIAIPAPPRTRAKRRAATNG